MEEKVIKAMENAATANGSLNWELANEIAEEFGLKPRAIVASAVRNKIPYARKVRTTKSGEKVVSKSDLVEKIAARFEIPLEDLDGLTKATKDALKALAGE